MLGSFVLIIACLYWAKAVLMPVALAVLITFLLNPIVNALYGRGLPRIPAVLVVVVLAFTVVGGVVWTVTRQLAMLAYELPRYQENLKEKMSDLRALGENSVIERVLTTFKEITEEAERAPRPPTEPQIGIAPRQVPQGRTRKAGACGGAGALRLVATAFTA